MKLNLGDKVIWIEDDNGHQRIKGKVVSAPFEDEVAIEWENGRTIYYSMEQLLKMKKSYYTGTMILDVEAMRQDKLEKLGIL